MESNTHYQKAVDTEPAMVRGSDLAIREILNRTTEATLALAAEQRLANLISLSSMPDFAEEKEAIIAEIKNILGFGSGLKNQEDDTTARQYSFLPEPVDESQYGVVEFKKPFI